jgi:TonB-linked SusC/RagA family outer membrane protein
MQLVQAQKTISGTVTNSEDGVPIPGATVLVKNTTIGTTTNEDGFYELTVPQEAKTLVFSFVGRVSLEVEISSVTKIDAVLEPDIMDLEGVVVTALGIPREKKSLGYAVQEVTGDDLNKASNPNLQTALSGKFAGVEVRQSSGMPGSPTQIMIRGARSFSGNNTPLYVVDGMPITSTPDYAQNVTGAYYSNRALDIDPNDIESISVLKGQAAAALYGLRASNGVIIITTKKGTTAQAGRPVSVTLSTSYTTDVVARLPEVQQTYGQGYYNDFYPAFSYSWGPKLADLANNPTYGGNNFEHPGQFFDPYKGTWVDPTIAYNNAENFYNKNGGTWNNSVNISGATNSGNYAVGFSTANQNGIIPETGMDRYNAKAAGNFEMNDKWSTGFSTNFSDISLQKIPSGNSSWLFTVYGAPPSFDLMGTPYHMEGPLGDYRQISYRRGAVGENPRWALENNHFYENTTRFFGNTYLEYAPVDWMKIKYQIGVDAYNTDNEDLYQMGSAGTGQILPAASKYPTPENPVYGYQAPTGGSINNYGVMRTIINSLATITFTKQFGENWGGSLILGNEFNDNKSRYWTMLGTGFTTPGWNNMSNTTTQTADESKYWDRTVGFFGNLSVDYKGMIYLNLTGRNDIASTMPSENRSFFYPSASLGWVFTELGALQGGTILNFGKLRVSYAEVGQAGDFNPNVYVLGGAGSGFLSDGILFPLGGISGFKPSTTIYDPNLKPENTATIEFGVELKLFNDRIGIDYTYSDQNAQNQIFAVPLAGSTGYASYVRNAGQMSSTAHEIVLYLTPVKLSDFEWNFFTNFTKIKNVCDELAPGVESISLGGYVTPNIRASAGDTYPAIYGNQFLRDDQGRLIIDDNPDSYYYGMPQFGDFGKIGDVTPDFIMSFTNTFTFFDFVTLGVQLDWKQGGQMYSGSNRLMGLYGTSAVTEDRETPFIFGETIFEEYECVLPDGTPNTIQRGGVDDFYAYPDLYNDVLGSLDEAQVYETSFLKFREIALTINLPKKIIDPLKLQGLSVNLFTRNILLWTTLPNFDPETSQGMGNMQGGMDYMSLPQTTSYGAGLNIIF